jgi:hypothetical protein
VLSPIVDDHILNAGLVAVPLLKGCELHLDLFQFCLVRLGTPTGRNLGCGLVDGILEYHPTHSTCMRTLGRVQSEPFVSESLSDVRCSSW